VDYLWITTIDKPLKLGLKKFLFSGGMGGLFSLLICLTGENTSFIMAVWGKRVAKIIKHSTLFFILASSREPLGAFICPVM
jgi:hypothetical protein